MKYFIYCRRSSEEESKQVQSLETQERELHEYATKYNLEIKEIIKESKSAKTDGNRPLFTKMFDAISHGEASGILVHHIDRLSRNGIESGMIIKLFESGLLQEIRTPSRIYASVQDMLYMDFDFVFASHYSRNLSNRVKEGNKTKLLKGEYIGCPPLGYIYQKAKLVPDPLSAKHIKKGFTLYATGQYTEKQLVNILYKDGLRSRLANNKVPKSSIHTFLRNPVYYGVIKRDGMFYKGIHKPLVNKNTYDKVQLVLQGKNRTKVNKLNFLYKNYLWCSFCGCKLTSTRKKEKYDYYYCTNGKGKCIEHEKYLTEKEVFELLHKIMKGLTLDKKMADMAFDIYKEKFLEKQKEKVSYKETIKGQITNIDKKLERLLNLFLNEGINEELYKEKQKALQNQKTELEIEYSNAKEQNASTTLELLEKFKNQACELEEMFKNGNPKVKRYLLNSVLWNCKIKEKKVASIQYKLPYTILEKMAKNPKIDNLLSSLDSNQNKRIQSPLSYR